MAISLRRPRAGWTLLEYLHCTRIPRSTTSLSSPCNNLGSMAQVSHRAVRRSAPLESSDLKRRMEVLLTKLLTAAHRLCAHNRFPHHNSLEVSPGPMASPPRHLRRSISHRYRLARRKAITKHLSHTLN
jgi:hypothetical protein